MSQIITVEGMSCEHCEESVTDALEAVDGVESATADRERSSAVVEGTTDTKALVNAVREAGYDASA